MLSLLIAECLSARHIIVQCGGWISARIYIFCLHLGMQLTSCGRNKTWSHDIKSFRYSPCCFPAAKGAWFWYFWLSYKVFYLIQVTIRVKGNVVWAHVYITVAWKPGLLESPRERRRRLDRERRRSHHENVDFSRSES